MKRRALRQRLDSLDGGIASLCYVWVNLEIVDCTTQEQYDGAVAGALAKIPFNAVVFLFPTLSESEYLAAVRRHSEDLPPLIDYRMGIYLNEGRGGE